MWLGFTLLKNGNEIKISENHVEYIKEQMRLYLRDRTATIKIPLKLTVCTP